MKHTKALLTLAGVLVISGTTIVNGVAEGFVGRKVKDCYPLHHLLQLRFVGSNPTNNTLPTDLVRDIVKELDIENNERYFKTGVVYKNGGAYEIPLNEVEDFEIKVSHTNTYCNIFVMDVLNIIANTTRDESYRTWKRPIRANDMRYTLENSKVWEEVGESSAIKYAQGGNVVIMSYKKNPTGHVSILRPDSVEGTIRTWNVGAVNSSNHIWKPRGDTKYFRKK